MLRLAQRVFSALRLRTSQATRLLTAPVHWWHGGVRPRTHHRPAARLTHLRQRRSFRPQLEVLEIREVLSPTVQFSAASYSVSETVGSATIPVTLSTSSDQTITVQYTTGDGWSKAGVDYTATSGTLTFNPGQTSANIAVPILDDHFVNEIAPEEFNITLSNPSNATLASPSTTFVWITEDNDDGVGLPPPALTSSFSNSGALNEPGSLAQVAPNQGVPDMPAQANSALVRYGDGVVTIAQTDLHSSGFGFDWGQTRSWSNGTGYAQGSDNGSGWVDTYTPHLLQADGSTNTTLIFIANGNTAYYYDLVNGVYQGRYYDGSLLSYNSGDHTYTLTDTQGDQIVFNDFSTSLPAAQRGEFASYADPYGYTAPNATPMVVTSYSDGHIGEMQRSATSGGNTTLESWQYSYLPSTDANAGLLSNVTLQTKVNSSDWNIVRQVQYVYYDGTQSYGGSLGDLMTATVEDGSAIPNVLGISYYRYYTSNSSTGYTHGLEYVFNPDSYLRMTAANPGISLGNLTDSDVSRFADNYFQYDSQQRVTLEKVQGAGDSQNGGGGLGTYQFSYTASGYSPGNRTWAMKTVVTNPDASTDTVYTNFVHEVMLDDHSDSVSGHTINAYNYDFTLHLTFAYAPSAVLGYSDANPDLLDNVDGNYQDISNSSGLVTVYNYWTTTTATDSTAGLVAGYLQSRVIRQGQTGDYVEKEFWEYYAHAFAGQTIAPIASDSVYRYSNDTGAENTFYTYSWYSGTAQIQSETVTAPVISSAENGPGTADVTTTLFDIYGNAQWTKDPDDYIEQDSYDPVTGALLTQIVDDNTNLPANWTALSGSHLNLTTTAVVDALGRTIEETSPNGNITYYVYLDPEHEERIYQGWNSSNNPPNATAPTQVIHHDAYDGYDETLTMTATPHPTNGAPDGTEAVSGLQTLTRDYTNAAGQVVFEDAYFNLNGLNYIPATMGDSTNYYQTNYAYDSDGRLVRTQTPNGTIYRTVYNSLGEEVSAWVGTNDTPTSGEWSPTNNNSPCNMVMVSSYAYDIEGNQTQETDYPGLGQPNRETDSWYDWQDRLVAQKSGVESSETDGVNRPIIVYTYDNLGEVTETQEYDGDGVTPTISNGVLSPLSASLLRSQEIDSYDDQGRVYQTQVYDVNPSTGAVSSSALTTNDYYDHRGDLIAEDDPGGLWTKSVYDGAGRDVKDYTTDGAAGTTWAEADSVANDTVLEQDQTVYDNDGNVIETIDSQRFNNATGTGALGSPTSGIGARVSYAANYYDNADRLTATVDVGTDGGSAWTRPSTAPTSSATVLVTTDVYNAMGLVQDVTDPMGIDERTLYDNLGRTTETIQHYTGGTPGSENDVATEYGYDGNNNVTYVRADEPGGSYQQTDYVYGDTTAAGDGVNSNDIQSALEHPDPTTGQPSSSQEDSDLVNALGEVVRSIDRNGNVHQYSYDVLGRETSDAVTTLGAGVDGSVRRIEYAYDSQGNQYLVTSYDAASGGNIVNQVEDVYDGLDQLTGEYQSHSGAVVPGTTPEVQYAYTEMSGQQNNSRLVSMTYPDGYVLTYNYTTGLDSNISRLSSISDSGGVLESYKYMGPDTIVERDHPQINVNQTFISQNGQPGDGGDEYSGLDRFDRVVNDNWVNASTGVSTDDFSYGYNPDGDVLSKQNGVPSGLTELYQYDPLHRLTNFQRGTDSQGWTLDALGNITDVTGVSPQSRTNNQQNELTSVGGTAVTYDKNGNMTTDADGTPYTYDAWNRLVSVLVAGFLSDTYVYDGLGRVLDGNLGTDLYYSSAGQVVEEDVGGVKQAQNVWSPVYVNALVLRDQANDWDSGNLDTRLYVQQDANWNVTALVDGTTNLGSVLERYDYMPYGAVTVLNSDFSVHDPVFNLDHYAMPYLWQGMLNDSTTNLYFSQSGGPSERVYSPEWMIWMQTDPSGLIAGNNGYAIDGNNPTNRVDPTGKEEYPPILYPRPNDSKLREGFPPGPDQWTKGRVVPVLVLYDAEDNTAPYNLFVADRKHFTKYAKMYPNISIERGQNFAGFEKTVEQIEKVAAKHGKIIDLRIYDHGAPGNQQIGDVWLSDIIKQRPDLIRRLGKSMAVNGGIGLYGCNVGEQRKLLEDLAKLTEDLYSIRASTKSVAYFMKSPDPWGSFDVVVYPFMGKKKTK